MTYEDIQILKTDAKMVAASKGLNWNKLSHQQKTTLVNLEIHRRTNKNGRRNTV